MLGHGTTVFDDLKTYMESLGRLRKEGHRCVEVIYPGHGKEIKEGGMGVIDAYISHRMFREKQILGVLEKRKGGREGGRGMTPLQIVKEVYESSLPAAVVSWVEGGGGGGQSRDGGREGVLVDIEIGFPPLFFSWPPRPVSLTRTSCFFKNDDIGTLGSVECGASLGQAGEGGEGPSVPWLLAGGVSDASQTRDRNDRFNGIHRRNNTPGK